MVCQHFDDVRYARLDGFIGNKYTNIAIVEYLAGNGFWYVSAISGHPVLDEDLCTKNEKFIYEDLIGESVHSKDKKEIDDKFDYYLTNVIDSGFIVKFIVNGINDISGHHYYMPFIYSKEDVVLNKANIKQCRSRTFTKQDPISTFLNHIKSSYFLENDYLCKPMFNFVYMVGSDNNMHTKSFVMLAKRLKTTSINPMNGYEVNKCKYYYKENIDKLKKIYKEFLSDPSCDRLAV